jgi:hypothetical protein
MRKGKAQAQDENEKLAPKQVDSSRKVIASRSLLGDFLFANPGGSTTPGRKPATPACNLD